ncbi:MAG: glycosyltransferase family 4 protein [Candidatus Hydrogenedentes bacterium]|nr:glycosyltransferase family 4 protein [Candidatus Hydrogenedentota bacterium]
MNILIPTADYPPIEGGISTVTVHLSRELAQLGHTVTVIAPYFPGQETFDQNEPVTVLRYGGYALGWFRFIPLMLRSWSHAMKADLVVGINVAYGGLLGMLTRRRYVAFAYAYEFLKFHSWSPAGRLLRRVYANAASVIAISRFTRDKLAEYGVDEHRIHVVHPGAEVPAIHNAEHIAATRARYLLDGKRVILAVGRLVPRKGHLTLLEAVARVLPRVPDAHLVIVGQGPLMSACCRLAHTLGIRDHVTFAGRLDDEGVAALYALCDVFALPTGTDARGQVEGFGLVFTEAHAHGKPVVAGRSGGVVDAVLDGETGLLVEPGDADALADALMRILTDPDLARRLGHNGRQRVERELNWTTFTRRVLETVGSGA